jgi:hypothetical protein
MSVYRKNKAGASFKDHYRDVRFLRNRIMMYKGINEETNHQFDKSLRKNIARYYRMLLDARQLSRSYFRRAGLAANYLFLKGADLNEVKEVTRDYILPKWIMSTYSFVALLPYRFRQSSH